MVTVIIPFRNEAENLPSIYRSVRALNYRPLQVLFVNDCSEDNSVFILSKLLAQTNEVDMSFEILHAQGIGKKSALHTGIQHACSEIILTTDADCDLPVFWVDLMVSSFIEKEVQLVAGPVISEGGTDFLRRFQQIEWASVLLATQTGFALRKPLMCSGANLAYRKSAFLEVDGYIGNEHIMSGDDEFLLKKVIRHFGVESVRYIKEEEVLVLTKAQASWSRLFSQKVRWASKWKLHQSAIHSFSSILPVLFQLIFLSSFVLLSQGKQGVIVFCFLWGAKIISEYWSLSFVLGSFSINQPRWSVSLTSIFHPIYVMRVVFGALLGKFDWKGRNSLDKP